MKEERKVLKEVTIITHEKFHIDEAVAILLLWHFGERIGVKVIDIQFVTESYCKTDSNKIYLGVGGGELDEHVFNGNAKNKGKSTVMLVAEKLKITDPNYLSLIKYAHNNDVNGPTKMTEFGNLLKEKFNQGQKEKDVFKFANQILLQKLNSLENKNEFKKIAKEVKNEQPLNTEILKTLSFYFNFEIKSIKRFVLRKHFSINDVIAVKAIQVFGKKFLVNPSKPEKTRIEFLSTDNYTPRKGDLVIGFGDCEFGKLPALKMFNILNIKKEGKFKLLFNLVNNLNNSSGYHPWELQGLLIDRFLDNNNSCYDNFIFAIKELNVFLRKQQLFLNAKSEIKKGFQKSKSRIRHIKGKKVGIFQLDNKMTANVAFSYFECDVVIIKNSNGQVLIQTKTNRKGERINISNIVFKLRLEEMLIKGNKYEDIDLKLLSSAGTITNCLEWYYHKPVQALLNGGNTHSGINPTKLSLGKIERIVIDRLK